MSYHLRELPKPKCANQLCGKFAAVQLYNDVNAPLGCYCKPCGARRLREALQAEKRKAKGNPW